MRCYDFSSTVLSTPPLYHDNGETVNQWYYAHISAFLQCSDIDWMTRRASSVQNNCHLSLKVVSCNKQRTKTNEEDSQPRFSWNVAIDTEAVVVWMSSILLQHSALAFKTYWTMTIRASDSPGAWPGITPATLLALGATTGRLGGTITRTFCGSNISGICTSSFCSPERQHNYSYIHLHRQSRRYRESYATA